MTSIAKHYNIPIADLKNANKIENERKLNQLRVALLAALTPTADDTPPPVATPKPRVDAA